MKHWIKRIIVGLVLGWIATAAIVVLIVACQSLIYGSLDNYLKYHPSGTSGMPTFSVSTSGWARYQEASSQALSL